MKFYFFPLILILLISCVDTNLRQTSESIDDAKKKGVFEQEYRPLINPIIKNDSTKMEVSSAWIEAGWYYDDKYGRTTRDSGERHLRIKLKDTVSIYYGVYWQIGRGYNNDYIRTAGTFDLITDLKKEYEIGDTLVYYVRKGYATPSDNVYDTTQKVIFVPVLPLEKPRVPHW